MTGRVWNLIFFFHLNITFYLTACEVYWGDLPTNRWWSWLYSGDSDIEASVVLRYTSRQNSTSCIYAFHLFDDPQYLYGRVNWPASKQRLNPQIANCWHDVKSSLFAIFNWSDGMLNIFVMWKLSSTAMFKPIIYSGKICWKYTYRGTPD